MNKYFRITAYNTKLGISAVFDCRNVFDKPTDFENYLMEKGFDDILVRKHIKNVDCGNLPPILNRDSFIACRACAYGEPLIQSRNLTHKILVFKAFFTCLPAK